MGSPSPSSFFFSSSSEPLCLHPGGMRGASISVNTASDPGAGNPSASQLTTTSILTVYSIIMIALILIMYMHTSEFSRKKVIVFNFSTSFNADWILFVVFSSLTCYRLIRREQEHKSHDHNVEFLDDVYRKWRVEQALNLYFTSLFSSVAEQCSSVQNILP